MAQKDIKSARILFEHGADNEMVCFHCQQAIEKYLKGYLIYATGVLHEGHSSIKLCKKAMTHNKVFSKYLKDVAFVNTYYIETRYPTVDPLVVDDQDVLECLRIADSIVNEVNTLINQDS